MEITTKKILIAVGLIFIVILFFSFNNKSLGGNITEGRKTQWTVSDNELKPRSDSWGLSVSSTVNTGSAVFNVDGSITLGTSTDNNLTVTARLASDLDPNANNSIDLGAYGVAYNDLFASGTVYTANLTADGNTVIGNATSDTLTITALLASDLDPNANNTIDLGLFGKAYKDIYTSSTVYAGDMNDYLYFDNVNSRIGISSSTPSAILSIGDVNTTSTIDAPQLCFRTTVDIGGVDTEVYYYPCVGLACPNVLASASGWATSTVSCF